MCFHCSFGNNYLLLGFSFVVGFTCSLLGVCCYGKHIICIKILIWGKHVIFKIFGNTCVPFGVCCFMLEAFVFWLLSLGKQQNMCYCICLKHTICTRCLLFCWIVCCFRKQLVSCDCCRFCWKDPVCLFSLFGKHLVVVSTRCLLWFLEIPFVLDCCFCLEHT